MGELGGSPERWWNGRTFQWRGTGSMPDLRLEQGVAQGAARPLAEAALGRLSQDGVYYTHILREAEMPVGQRVSRCMVTTIAAVDPIPVHRRTAAHDPRRTVASPRAATGFSPDFSPRRGKSRTAQADRPLGQGGVDWARKVWAMKSAVFLPPIGKREGCEDDQTVSSLLTGSLFLRLDRRKTRIVIATNIRNILPSKADRGQQEADD